MCGLWGGASYNLSDIEVERIAQLGVVSQLRGVDSTGMLSCYRQDGKIGFKIMKEVTHSSDFIYDKPFTDHVKSKKPFLIAGHCRQATIGSVNYENAHPYTVDHIVGMKNGTIPFVPGKLAEETDSKALLRLIHDEGIEVAAKIADKGGCAVVWADTRNLSLNFYRNSGRTLYIMTVGGTIYWASEYMMLALVRDRTGIKYEAAKIDILPMEVHRRYKMSHGFNSFTDQKIKIQRVVYNLGQNDSTTTVTKEPDILVKVPTNTEKEKKETAVPVTKKPATIKVHDKCTNDNNTLYKIQGFKELTMTPGKAIQILQRGCAHCAAKIPVKDIETVSMFTKKDYLCDACSIDPFAVMQTGAHNKTLYPCKIITGKTHGSC